MASVAPPRSRSGSPKIDASDIRITVANPSNAVSRAPSEAAATVTGASTNSVNGFDKPPVSASSADSCTRSKASCPTTRSRDIGRRDAIISHRFSIAAAATSASTGSSGKRSPSSQATTTAAPCPATATQRSRISVRLRTGSALRGNRAGSLAVWREMLSGNVQPRACDDPRLDTGAGIRDQCADESRGR